MENYELLTNLITLTDYTLALMNGNPDDIASAREKLVKQLESTSEEGYDVDVLDSLLRVMRDKHDSYILATAELTSEIEALGWNEKIDAATLCKMMQATELTRTGNKLAEALKCHAEAMDKLETAKDFMREISLTYLRQMLSYMLASRAFINYSEQMRRTLTLLQTFTRSEIEQYGLSAHMFLR